VAVETMPVDACIYFYQCINCRALLRPLRGDCCVFCSYGSVKCPPIQSSTGCCSVDALSPKPWRLCLRILPWRL